MGMQSFKVYVSITDLLVLCYIGAGLRYHSGPVSICWNIYNALSHTHLPLPKTNECYLFSQISTFIVEKRAFV